MTNCTAAVVLAAGRGTRMQRSSSATLEPAQAAAAARGAKAMVPDALGRPFLDHVLSALVDGGITDACLVIRNQDDTIPAHYRQHAPRHLRLVYATQSEPRGTADALLAAETWIAGRSFAALNADNVYPAEAIAALVRLDMPGLVAFDRATLIAESNIDPVKLAAFATVTLDADDRLRAIVEKPGPETGDASDWISMNLWRFDPRIFDACRAVPPSPRGELELPLAVALAVDSGVAFQAVRLRAGVLDLSSRDDVGVIARQLAEREVHL